MSCTKERERCGCKGDSQPEVYAGTNSIACVELEHVAPLRFLVHALREPMLGFWMTVFECLKQSCEDVFVGQDQDNGKENAVTVSVGRYQDRELQSDIALLYIHFEAPSEKSILPNSLPRLNMVAGELRTVLVIWLRMW